MQWIPVSEETFDFGNFSLSYSFLKFFVNTENRFLNFLFL